MNDYSLIIIVVLLFTLIYILFKMHKTRQLEDLVIEKQKEKKVVLERKKYRYEYTSIFVLLLLFVFTFSFDNNQNTDSMTDIEYLNQIVSEELPELLNSDFEGVYIVTIDSEVATTTYQSDNVNATYIDINTYQVRGESVSLGTEDMLFSSSAIDTVLVESLLNTQAGLTNYIEYSSAPPIEVSHTYLVIGAYLEATDSTELEDERIQDLEFLYPWNIFLIEGYDKEKSIHEQSQLVKEEIIRIIREYLD